MQQWFIQHHQAGWATCPITENGMIPRLSQPAYASGKRSPAEVIDVLSALKRAFSDTCQFWPDEVWPDEVWPADLSLADDSRFDKILIAGTKQVTDAYLLGLAALHMAVLSALTSLCRGMPSREDRQLSSNTPAPKNQLNDMHRTSMLIDIRTALILNEELLVRAKERTGLKENSSTIYRRRRPPPMLKSSTLSKTASSGPGDSDGPTSIFSPPHSFPAAGFGLIDKRLDQAVLELGLS